MKIKHVPNISKPDNHQPDINLSRMDAVDTSTGRSRASTLSKHSKSTLISYKRLVVEPYPSEKWSSSVGMMTFPIYGNIKFMFQTTTQIQTGVYVVEEFYGMAYHVVSIWCRVPTRGSTFPLAQDIKVMTVDSGP